MKKNLTILARRWFDKTGGNTYHSCKVFVNGKIVGRKDFEYGYDEGYMQTALTILQENGIYKKTDVHLPSGMDKDYMLFISDIRNNKYNLIKEVVDVSRRKDLI